ncbi:MAG: hypothetical protein JJU20_07365 [Opitutales bacterium]|nr:hypothetical protein [Opitutales bacterium]
MEISALQAASIQPGSSQNSPPMAAPDPEELRKASQQFEAIFIRQFIEKSLTPLLADPMSTPDGSADIHRHMIADVLAESLSQQSVFGLSDILELQLRPQDGMDPNAAHNISRR